MDPVRTLAWIFLALVAVPVIVLALIIACYVALAVVAGVTG